VMCFGDGGVGRVLLWFGVWESFWFWGVGKKKKKKKGDKAPCFPSQTKFQEPKTNLTL
jgi:hypothetical protein